MPIIIGGLQKSSLIDYPEKISAVIFTQGCNFRCPYCHNPELINNSNKGFQPLAGEILEFLNSRIGKLDGVVITGGEPTLHADLPEFIKQIKEFGFAVKLDTNGTNPEMLWQLIDKKLIDYVAMDIKAPIEGGLHSKLDSNQQSRLGLPTQQQEADSALNASRYEQIVCAKVDTNQILKSIEILKTSDIDYEFRTTVVKSQLESADFEKTGALIQGSPRYYLQRFLPTKTLDESFLNQITYSDEQFAPIIELLKKYVQKVELR